MSEMKGIFVKSQPIDITQNQQNVTSSTSNPLNQGNQGNQVNQVNQVKPIYLTLTTLNQTLLIVLRKNNNNEYCVRDVPYMGNWSMGQDQTKHSDAPLSDRIRVVDLYGCCGKDDKYFELEHLIKTGSRRSVGSDQITDIKGELYKISSFALRIIVSARTYGLV